jgi:hypothetical protein
MSGIEKRKHSRISISVPVSCVSIDQEGSPLNFNMGVVRDISQGGLALEVFREMESDLVLLSFVDVAGKTIELRGKSVYSKRNNSGTIKSPDLRQSRRLGFMSGSKPHSPSG